MLHLVPLSPEQQSIITTWFADDPAGNKELVSYKDVSGWLTLLNPLQRWGWIAYQGIDAIGFVDLEKDSSGVGHFTFYIAPDERGKGKSKELLLALVAEAQKLHIRSLQAGVDEDNLASQKSLESFGFVFTGTGEDNDRIYQLEISH
jgi:RimJ/RimL family protein N-acetyltransferase